MKTDEVSTAGRGQLKLLLASTRWWPTPAKLAIALLRHGCKVDAICPRENPLSFVPGIKTIYRYRNPDSLHSLKNAMLAADPDLVIPCDDGVVWQLHKLNKTHPELRPLIERSLGPGECYDIVESRLALMEVAQQLQIRVPKTVQIESHADLEEWFSSQASCGVLKLDGTWGGNGVRVVRNLGQAEQAIKALRRNATLVTACKRAVVDRDPIAFWNHWNHSQTKLTVQQFIQGRPANTMVACKEGEVFGIVTVEVLSSRSPTGPATVVRLSENAEMKDAAERIADRLQLSGLFGLDFVLEDATGDAYLIELNPRCTPLGHLRVAGKGDLAGALCRAFAQQPVQLDEVPIGEDTIVFFPQALYDEPKSPYLETGYVDAPWEVPQLVRELMREEWPNRQLMSKIYRSLRPPEHKAVETDVETRLEGARLKHMAGTLQKP